MANKLEEVVQLLEASLRPQQQKQAESAIRERESQPGFSLSLLQIVATQSYPNNSRLASALYFKNFVKRNWIDEDGNHKLPQDEVVSIKRELVGLMITVPPVIQTQLGEAISIIADSDFWERWDTLIDDLVSRLTPDNATTNNGVLQVAHSIFRRWRPLFRSDQLFTEILHVLERFGTPFMTLTSSTDSLIQQANAVEPLKQLFTTLNLSLKIMYDLSCLDLPQIFVDNLADICAFLARYLSYDNQLLHTGDESEAGPIEFVKAGIFELLTLWVQKYEEDVGPHIQQFVGISWNLLTTLGPDTKYDILTSRALTFLTSVCALKQYAEAFNNQQILTQVVEQAIIPNLSLREADVELFEDEPIEYIRRDLEGTDSETRRRAATDFLRQLMQQFQELVTSTVMQYVNHYLQQYSSDASKWREKDTAVYLFCSVAAVGAVTAAQGVLTTNPNVNVIEFFQNNIAQDLVNDASNVISQVDAIKFLYIFRTQMTQSQWQEAFPLVVKHLQSDNYVVYTYSAIAIERILALTKENEPVIPRSSLTTSARDILRRLFQLIEKDTAPEKIQENEFLMRCVMRVLLTIRDGVMPITDFVLQNLINITRVIRHNPSNPRFYYYLFESIGALVRYAAPSQPDKLESTLFAPFAEILQNDVQEFMPYVFQLFAALLEANPSASLSEYYQGLIQPVLMPSLWQSKGNTPALVRLLSSLIKRGGADMAKNNQVEPILGVFQQLISQKSNEAYGFDLLEACVAYLPPAALAPHFGTIFQLLLTRLSRAPSQTFTNRFVRLYHFLSARTDVGLGCDAVIATIDGVEQGVFTQLYLAIILPGTQKLSRPADRKLAVVSLTRTLAYSQAFAEKYQKGWGFTCEALLKLMLNPPIPAATDDLIPDQDVDDLAFGVGFTQLNTCKRPSADPYPEIADVKVWIGTCLKEADAANGGRISGFIQQRLSAETQQTLLAYMQS